jgi:hypothetical protein
VYKLSKALYEKQAPRTWYARFNTFLLEHGYVMGSVDKTLYFETWQWLFTCSDLHWWYYLWWIFSLSYVKFLGSDRERIIDVHDGRTKIFLRHSSEADEDIFVHKAKYMKDLIKKFKMAELKPVSTPMSTTTTLDPDENDETIH